MIPVESKQQEQFDGDGDVSAILVAEDIIAINGRNYCFETVAPSDGISCHVRLSYGDPFTDGFEVYDVAVMESGYYECSCADFIYRSGPGGWLCKHVRGCRDCGLIGPVGWTEREMNEQSAAHDDGWRVADKDGNCYENVFTGEREGL